MKTRLQRRVLTAKVEGIENAYIAVSASWEDEVNERLSKRMSFFYVASENCIVEWEPKYGPITVIYKCDETDENAEPHWWFDFCSGHGNWTQIEVDRRGLKKDYVDGDYKHIFGVLSEYGD